MTTMSVATMRMLRLICGNTRNDRIKNVNIRDMVGISPTYDKLRENRFKWFGHICRRPIDVIVRRSEMVISSDNT